MNVEQFNRSLKFVFAELQASGLPVDSDVFVVLTKLFSEYKMKERVLDEANQRSIDIFGKLIQARQTIVELNTLLEQNNINLHGVTSFNEDER